MSDNLNDIYRDFGQSVCPGCIEGYKWICKHCGLPVTVVYTYFHCQDKWVISRIRCHLGCRRTWKLEITPDGEHRQIH